MFLSLYGIPLKLHLRDVIRISEKEKIKITEMCVPTNGELYPSDTACSGDIVILPNDVLQLNSILGNEMLLPQRTFSLQRHLKNPTPHSRRQRKHVRSSKKQNSKLTFSSRLRSPSASSSSRLRQRLNRCAAAHAVKQTPSA